MLTSRLGLVSAGEANVSVSSRLGLVSVSSRLGLDLLRLVPIPAVSACIHEHTQNVCEHDIFQTAYRNVTYLQFRCSLGQQWTS